MITARRTLTFIGHRSSITRRPITYRVTILATYQGGAYVDLRFCDPDDVRVSSINASEVINVWNYEKGRSELSEHNQKDLARVLSDWITEQDAIEVDDEHKPIVLTGRMWLRAYVDNAR